MHTPGQLGNPGTIPGFCGRGEMADLQKRVDHATLGINLRGQFLDLGSPASIENLQSGFAFAPGTDFHQHDQNEQGDDQNQSSGPRNGPDRRGV